MAKLIRLNKVHRIAKRFKHPLLDDAKAYTEEELALLTEAVLANPTEGHKLIWALRSCLRHHIGLYLNRFPECYLYLDDMVSEGFLAITQLVNDISLDLLNGRTILRVASKRLMHSLDTYLNRVQALVSAGLWVQKRRVKDGDEPVYGDCATNSYNGVEPAAPDFLGSSDAIEALNKLVAQDSIDAHILCPTYWGWSGQQLGELLGVDRREISRRRHRLLKEYRELTR